MNQYDAVVIGAGFAGIYMVYRLKQQGLQVRVFEAGSGVGGTWFWNRYPGARCDIPSMEYSYQFSEPLQQEWEWTEKYATQAEILDYAEHVVERFGLSEYITFNTKVTAAEFDEATSLWTLTLSDGQTCQARYVVAATGCLSVPNYPDIDGLDRFQGPVHHTGQWPQDGVDFTGKRVAVIGTGSSAIQSLPIIADQAKSVTVFQRTPNYSIPARNAPLEPDYVKAIKARYSEFRQENWQRGFGADFRDGDQSALEVTDEARQAEFEDRWQRGGLAFLAAYNDLAFNKEANDTARNFFVEKIKQRLDNPALADKLIPSMAIGCKRLCVDTDYYETYNQPHVTLVDLNEEPIKSADATGLTTANGHYDADLLVLATGFDAMTGALTNMDITGKAGKKLKDKWTQGPKAYLGLATAGFPNLFIVTGPGSPSVLSNMLPSIEHHVEWISDCIAFLNAGQYRGIEADKPAEEAWVAHVNEVGDASIFPSCNSWYVGANVKGKKRVFMPYLGVPPYVEKCQQVVAGNYEGFTLRKS